MLFDPAVLVSVGSVLVVGLGLVLTNNVRYLTLREHEAYLKAMSTRIDDILDRIKILEQTRPTTGELKAWVTRQINGKE